MDLNRSLSEFIIEEFIPAATHPANRFALGVLASAGGVFGFDKVSGALSGVTPEQIEVLLRAGFAVQPTLTLRLADFVNEEAAKKFPIINLPFIRNVLNTPYDIDLEAAEKLIAKLKQY
jgi:hypothetical protein